MFSLLVFNKKNSDKEKCLEKTTWDTETKSGTVWR